MTTVEQERICKLEDRHGEDVFKSVKYLRGPEHLGEEGEPFQEGRRKRGAVCDLGGWGKVGSEFPKCFDPR